MTARQGFASGASPSRIRHGARGQFVPAAPRGPHVGTRRGSTAACGRNATAALQDEAVSGPVSRAQSEANAASSPDSVQDCDTCLSHCPWA